MNGEAPSPNAWPVGVDPPGYRPGTFSPGIVHLGLGAFHRAHQAVYTDDALAAAGGDWRIVAVSLRSAATADALTRQGNWYSLIVRDEAGAKARVVGSIADALSAPRDPEAVLRRLADPAIRIVTLTVTEKAYGLNRETGGLDPAHEAVAHDLRHPDRPVGVIGYLVEALRRRREAGTPPFTVLCCDNFPENGKLVRRLVSGFASEVDGELAAWIESEVAFPSSMVDRITPAPTPETLALAEDLLGRPDAAAVEAEPFSQWVIEDNFPTGRPAWEAGGALFVADVAPYEKMKLRMLNGAHSLIAYAGFLAGHACVRDAMADTGLVWRVNRHIRAAARTLDPVPGIDLGNYGDDLMRRFANPFIAHETYQIAMDGTEKLPQRLLQPAMDALARGEDADVFALAVAFWMRYALGRTDAGETYELRDPRQEQLAAATGGDADPGALAARLAAAAGVFPAALSQDTAWMGRVADHLARMLENGVTESLRAFA